MTASEDARGRADESILRVKLNPKHRVQLPQQRADSAAKHVVGTHRVQQDYSRTYLAARDKCRSHGLIVLHLSLARFGCGWCESQPSGVHISCSRHGVRIHCPQSPAAVAERK